MSRQLGLALPPSNKKTRSEPVPQVVLLKAFALELDQVLMETVANVQAFAPFRRMTTPGERRMSVEMTNCGIGWVSDKDGYRYERSDPQSGRLWPTLPPAFATLARRAASEAGFADFSADACLVNRYQPGTRLSLHQDNNERDLTAPIVSVSLGLPAVFLLGGFQRRDKPSRLHLDHGDVLVWGGAARLRYHGILPIKEAEHPLVGPYRINLTMRRAR